MASRAYETIFIINPETEEESRENIIERIENFITENGGEIKDIDNWDEKELAYEIDDYTTGYYTVMKFEAETSLIDELEYEFSIIPAVLRNLILKDED